MPFLSMGFVWTVICSKDATLSNGATMTVPLSVFGSMRAVSRVRATIDAYSVPWLPATNATTGPGFAPLTTATEMVVAASVPAGTVNSP